MVRFCAAVGLGCASMMMGSQGGLAQDFDNPTMGGAPCVILNHYAVEPSRSGDDGPLYGASATVENVCGRSVEVRFCFDQVLEEGEVERSCQVSPIRPWATSSVSAAASEARIAGPSYEWRYLP